MKALKKKWRKKRKVKKVYFKIFKALLKVSQKKRASMVVNMNPKTTIICKSKSNSSILQNRKSSLIQELIKCLISGQMKTTFRKALITSNHRLKTNQLTSRRSPKCLIGLRSVLISK